MSSRTLPKKPLAWLRPLFVAGGMLATLACSGAAELDTDGPTGQGGGAGIPGSSGSAPGRNDTAPTSGPPSKANTDAGAGTGDNSNPASIDAGGGTGASGTDAGRKDGGTSGTPPADAGAPPSVGTGAFAGAAAYSAKYGTTAHNPKKACLSCHGPGSGRTMKFGGTVFKDAAGTTPAAQVEIRVRDSSGKATLVSTDDFGNFFAMTGPSAFPALTGARNGSSTKLMVKETTSGDCNSCHNGGKTAFIVVP
jgi:hypothetical protein